MRIDRKSTRLNSSHLVISYAVFCLKKKKKKKRNQHASTEIRNEHNRITEQSYSSDSRAHYHCTVSFVVIVFFLFVFFFFFFNDTATTEIYTLSLHDALPISLRWTRPSTARLKGRLSSAF